MRVPAWSNGEQLVTHPFMGICLVHRTTESPRPLSYYVAIIDPATPGIEFSVTPDNGRLPRETTLQPTLAFLDESQAQLAINANFFSPFPSVDAYSSVGGLAGSDGVVYSVFEGPYDFGLNIGADNVASIVHREPADPRGNTTAEGIVPFNAVGAREQILTDGMNTADWPELHPRSAAGVTETGELVLVAVDGRQEAISEGVTTTELADIMREFSVTDAINLDGGGSSTLAISDPRPRLHNVPSSLATERAVGNSLAVFADPWRSPEPAQGLIAHEPFEYPHRDCCGATWPTGGGVVDLLGGTGWASAWRDDYAHSRATGIAVFPADAGVEPDARTTALSYTDSGGLELSTSGAQLRTSFGTSSSAWRVIDLTRVDPAWLTEDGRLGASGTRVWLSFLAQSFSGDGGDRWAYVELGDTLRIGRHAVEKGAGSWGLHVMGQTPQTSSVPSAEPVFIAVAIDFADAQDTVSMWINPDLNAAPVTPDVTVTLDALEIHRVVVSGRYSTDFDELRIGTTWSSVTPTG